MLSYFINSQQNKELLTRVKSQQKEGFQITLKGLFASAKCLPMASLAMNVKNRLLVVVEENDSDAAFVSEDLTTLLSSEQVFYFPTSYKGKDVTKKEDESLRVQRTAAIEAIVNWKPSTQALVLVTYPEALEEGVPDQDILTKQILTINKGDKLSHEFIKECLFDQGFERADFVGEPGQFALRGSIIDVFSYGENKPYRINFFGDQVEDVRVFEPNTQRSVETRDSVRIIPLLDGDRQVMDWLEDKALFCRKNCIYIKGDAPVKSVIEFNTVPQPTFNKNFQLLVNDLQQKKELGYKAYILSDSQAQIRRLEDIFESLGGSSSLVEYLPFCLHEGFVDHSSKVCFYTDHQLFQRLHRVNLKRSVQKSEQLTINDLNGFRIGDYVVHIDHGVGVFGGLVKSTINGKPQELIKLIYRDNDVLFVNIHGLHRIARYKSKDSIPPKINKLGTGAWNKLKQQTKKKVKDIAADLIKLYSQRRATRGFAFSHDSYLQDQLEASFLFEDTPDQLRATQDVKKDMEQPYPMDRLICGDVGFGKTEVAIRAAFKAVSDGKQVAVLVPTTILALQHYHTFCDRLDSFPVKVQYISRLKSPAEIKQTLDDVKEGKVDIIIGTHRLLNADVGFKDLGLLIIDEEQKFGVAAKEKLRQLKTNVDTLTMTATPIPRTLQFSLMGSRDLSIIQTPPANRLPIQTEVQLFDDELVRNAIQFEMDRGGQVFFVHNRVEDIQQVADRLQEIVPSLRIGIGHGQMPPKVLEKVLLDFICGDYDLLLATSIIENGIDIPNANTIIINRAHMFGLSDLHQMRGRVGRSNRKAYCYLLIPKTAHLTEEADRRLKAIEAFTELGSGFNIAMQDLDIRGAGNLLGGEQSGFMAEMGFETYQRILEEAFAELHAEHPEQIPDTIVPTDFLTDCTIDTDLEVLIPDDYISQVPEKIRLYKELDSMKDEEQLQRFFTSLEDRFGPIPEQLRQLGYIVRLRKLAVNLGFERIVLKNGIMLAYFIHDPHSVYYKTPLFASILDTIQHHPKSFQVTEQNDKLFVRVTHIEKAEAAYNLLKSFVKP